MTSKFTSRRGTIIALALVAVALVAAALLVFAGGDDTAPDSRYVALGDSYAAGMGIKPRDTDSTASCSRSTESYAFRIQETFDFEEFESVTCAGATIKDMYSEQPADGEPSADPQLDALTGDETLVSISISGNDAGFWSTVMQCLENTDPAATPCVDEYVVNGEDSQRKRIDMIRPYLDKLLDDITARSPDAQIYVMGYQRILPEDAATCVGEINVSQADAEWFDGWQRYLNAMVKAAAEAHGAEYLDIYSVSEGHDACADGERWLEPMIGAEGAHILHPNTAGHAAMTELVEEVWREDEPAN